MPDDVTHLHELMDQRWEAHQRVHETEEKSRDRAVETVNGRLAEMNNLRDQIQSERGEFLRMDTYNARHDELITRMNAVERTLATLAGRDRGVGLVWGVLLGVAGLVAGFVLFALSRGGP